MICAARIAAFVAPGFPIASVATGMPAGICTMLSSESIPFSDVEGIGTPSTGRIVFEAITPPRCAAPPAAAMMQNSPRCSADAAYSEVSSGVRCADRTFAS